ncbi:MAG: tRNA pseudouridine(55) synthase TruB [Actinomycetota bacterium]|nr:tRNA pseudouridine(55) synthase TruB [Actinomycetota bacterium]
MAAPDGLLIVDKPQGWTSHDVVARTRRLAETRKVGHAGTLDPMATGVLVIGIGRATRLLGWLALTDKAYDATIRLGQTTVTDDADGDLLESRDPSGVTQAAVIAAASTLTGDLQQVPSAVSAIKVKGERAYKRVRAGEEVTLPARPVTVSDLAVGELRSGPGTLDLDAHVECSTGTYVRALARDLGAALGVGGHLTALRRTRVGPYHVSRARTLAELAEGLDVIALEEAAAANFGRHTVGEDQLAAVRNGRALPQRLTVAEGPARSAEGGPVAIFSPDGEFLALYEQHGPVAKAVAVFAPA